MSRRQPVVRAPALVVILLAAACSGVTQPVDTAQPTTTTPATPATTTSTSTTTTTTPQPFDPLEATIPALQEAMESGRITAAELVDFHLARIDAYDGRGPALASILAVNPNARAQAEALDAERRAGVVRGPLHGIPIVLKDNINTADMPTTGGAAALEGFRSGDDADQVAALRAAGAVILAKANLHELARDITTVSSLGGQTLNPYDLTRNPGGSSGGTAVAVAANFAVVGLGTDTCGSIRIPAAHTNLYGLRPTVGLSSVSGVMPLAPTADTVGPLARSVVDLALVLDVTAGAGDRDPFSVDPVGSYLEAVDPSGLDGRTIGVLQILLDLAAAEVVDVMLASLDGLAAAGATVTIVDFPGFHALRGDAASVFLREFRFAFDSYLARYPHAPVASLAELVARGVHHPDVDAQLRRAVAVTTLDTAEYRDALDRRDRVRSTMVEFMDRHGLDALAYPAVGHPPAPLGMPQQGNNCGTASVGGLPAIVVPAGFTADGLPVGLELMGRPFAETTLIALAAGYEAVTDVRRLPPTTP